MYKFYGIIFINNSRFLVLYIARCPSWHIYVRQILVKKNIREMCDSRWTTGRVLRLSVEIFITGGGLP